MYLLQRNKNLRHLGYFLFERAEMNRWKTFLLLNEATLESRRNWNQLAKVFGNYVLANS